MVKIQITLAVIALITLTIGAWGCYQAPLMITAMTCGVLIWIIEDIKRRHE